MNNLEKYYQAKRNQSRMEAKWRQKQIVFTAINFTFHEIDKLQRMLS